MKGRKTDFGFFGIYGPLGYPHNLDEGTPEDDDEYFRGCLPEKSQGQPLRRKAANGRTYDATNIWMVKGKIRHAPQVTLTQIWEYIRDHPGAKKIEIIRLMGTKSTGADAILTVMETQGFLLCEDDHARLWIFKAEE